MLFLMKTRFKGVKITAEWIDLVSMWGLGDKRWMRKENTEFTIFIRWTVQLFCFSLHKDLENSTPKRPKLMKLVKLFQMICCYPFKCVRDEYWERYLLFKWYLLFWKKTMKTSHWGLVRGKFFLTYFVNDVCLMGFAPSTSSVLIPWQWQQIGLYSLYFFLCWKFLRIFVMNHCVISCSVVCLVFGFFWWVCFFFFPYTWNLTRLIFLTSVR